MADLLGLGVFGVIIDSTRDEFISRNDLEKIPPVKDSISSLAQLATGRFKEGNIYFFESAGNGLVNKLDKWMLRHNLYKATGITPGHLFTEIGQSQIIDSIKAAKVDILVHADIALLKALKLAISTSIFIFGASPIQMNMNPMLFQKYNRVADWQNLLGTIRK